jgi:hypothetical protein
MKPQKILVAVSLLAIPVIGFMAYSAASAPLPEGFPHPTTGSKYIWPSQRTVDV